MFMIELIGAIHLRNYNMEWIQHQIKVIIVIVYHSDRFIAKGHEINP